MAKKDFSVALVGGGIGGLSLAIGLHRANISVDIFEAAPAFAEIGAGVAFGSNASGALVKLGLGDEFDHIATRLPSSVYFEWRKAGKDDEKLIATTNTKSRLNAYLHRAKFLEVMVKNVPKEISHFGKRLTKIEELPEGSAHKLQLIFEDGTSHETDLVIGCDGIHSKVREHIEKINKRIDGEERKLQWSGSWAYRALIPAQKFKEVVGGEKGQHYADVPQMILGKDAHILWFPVDHFETINVVAFTTDRSQWPKRPEFPQDEPWTRTTSKEDMLSHFKGWGKTVEHILECIEKPSKWALHQLMPSLRTYVSGNIAVMGDAAHGGTPHQGAMAGQAIEDALFLSRLLSHPSVKASNLHEALQVYDKIRLPRANKVLESSLEAGDTYEFAGEAGDDEAKLKQNLENRFDWIWEHDHDAEFAKAVEEMKARGFV
ncbi:hypothetical protein CBS101457_001297 [Exobasidium rhododendri]|nr:hypothetical protein CBS101457_001297 [Exobasidium rhododendri]